MLYVIPTPVGAVIVIVPVAIEQLGCVKLTVGATGVAGWTFIVALVAVDTHPLFCTVTL